MAERRKQPVQIPGFLEQDSVCDFDVTSKMVGLSKVHLRRLIKAGKFPRPLLIGQRKFGWRAGTLQDFVAAKAAKAAQPEAA